MKRNITIFMVCILILSCFFGCAPKQIEPDATIAPTETVVAPTEEITEPPTEAVELTEEEQKQLYYEQMFADGTYVIDWSCVNIDVNTDYHLEQYSDENGIFWEYLRTHADFPEFTASEYFRPDENTAYFINTPMETEGGTGFYRLDNPIYQENVVSAEVLATQLLFEDCATRFREVWYVETVEGMDVVALDRSLLRGCLVYIDPTTNEVKRLHIYDAATAIDGGNTYYIEFVDKTVDDITVLDNLPITIHERTSFDKIVEACSQMIFQIKRYKFNNLGWNPAQQIAPRNLPTHRVVEESAETKAEKQYKWEQVFTNQDYIMDWGNVKIDYAADSHHELLTDDNGVFWRFVSDAVDSFVSYNAYYQREDGTSYFCTTKSDTESPRWYFVDATSEAPPHGQIANRCAVEQSSVTEYLNNIHKITYTKSVGGLDVVAVSGTHFGYGDATLNFYMDPETNEVKYIYTRYGKIEFVYYENRTDLNMDNMESIQQVMTYSMSPSFVLKMNAPETISKTITFADIERCNAVMRSIWFAHGTKEGAEAAITWDTEAWITGEPFVPAN